MPRRASVLMSLALCVCAVRAAEQPISVNVAGDALKVRAPGLRLLEGEPLARLKDGRALGVELALLVRSGPARPPAAAARRVFSLSYDLWEERFAVKIADSSAASASHLTSSAAEAWCVDQLAVPLASLGGVASVWVRLEYRILDEEPRDEPEADAGFTIQALIDAFSRRRTARAPLRGAIEGGPFQVPRRMPSAPPPR